MYGLDAAGVREALDRGANYLFWSPAKPFLKTVIREVVAKDRDRYVLATGPVLGYFPGSLRRTVEWALRESQSDYLDILQLFWAGVMSSLSTGMLSELVRLRDEGKVRAIGVAIHDRKRAARLAAAGPLDFFMLRYNAAHPGAEVEHLSAPAGEASPDCRLHGNLVGPTAAASARLGRTGRHRGGLLSVLSREPQR